MSDVNTFKPTTKPILKWAGGKSQIICDMIKRFPRTINDYYEPFIGGGSVLFAVLDSIRSGYILHTGRIFVSDSNETLINMYKNIQTNPDEIFLKINELFDIYIECDNKFDLASTKKTKEQYYYEIRELFNKMSQSEKNSIEGSSYFIFLNKTCFRGLYRENNNGEFNTSFGNYVCPYIKKEHLLSVSDLIKDVIFECCDFRYIVTKINTHRNDFIYLDPPYYSEKKGSFMKYTKNGFSEQCHYELFDIMRFLNKTSNMKIFMSNCVTIPRHFFFFFTIEEIECKRKINSKNPQDTTIEVFVYNYRQKFEK